MFANKRLMIGIITLLAAGVTFFIANSFKVEHDANYWYTLSSIWLSEILLGVNAMEIMKTDEDAMPFFLGNLSVSLLYFIFVIIAMFLLTGNISAKNLLITHIVVFFVIIVLHIFLAIAHDSTQKNIAENKNLLSSKKIFIRKISEFKMEKSRMLDNNKILNKKFSNLSDSVKFASESISGSEDIDKQINDEFDSFLKVSTDIEAGIIADKLISLFKFRSDIIKNLR